MLQESSAFKFVGEFRDIITENGETRVTDWSCNVVTKNINLLVATLLKIQTGYTGIQYWAVGSGNDTWDGTIPYPTPNPTDEKLVNEIGRKSLVPSDIKFVDAAGNPSSAPTNRILITAMFSESDVNGKWREFGIYGGNATSVKDSGFMINHKTHEVITKTASMVVERQLRFTFN